MNGYFAEATQTILLYDTLSNGDIIGQLYAVDIDDDLVTYAAGIQLSQKGMTLVPKTLGNGDKAADIVVVDWTLLWVEMATNPDFSFDASASDGCLSDTIRVEFALGSSASDFFGWLTGGGDGAPPWDEIPGYPPALPPAGKVTIILAHRSPHSFVILLDAGGGSTCYSGGRDGNGRLHADSGPLGDYERYEDDIDLQIIGTYDQTTIVDAFDKLVDDVNTVNQGYVINTNNCYCTSFGLLKRAQGKVGLTIPATADSQGTAGTNVGWNKMPDGVQ